MSDKPHFDISAVVVRQLGEELVSDELTALIELVRNAYDADATYANIVVNTEDVLHDDDLYYYAEAGQLTEQTGKKQNSDRRDKVDQERSKGYITIEDDGIGMRKGEIEKGWLTISYSEKRKMVAEGRLTLKRRRTPIGRKGLGRLSTQRLGYRLEMITCREMISTGNPELDKIEEENDESNLEHHVAFDWREFKENMPLTSVPVHFESKQWEEPRHGTKLIITELREPKVWIGDAGDKLVSGLSQLIFPFGEVRPFRVYLAINGTRYDLETISESIRDVAVSRFVFSFDEHDDKKLRLNGKVRLTRFRGIGEERREQYNELLGKDQGREFFAFLTNSENRHAIPDLQYSDNGAWFISYEEVWDLGSLGGLSLDEEGKVASPGPLKLEMDEFFLRGVDLGPLENALSRVADYRQFVSDQLGVRIYRDGFGIRPYGFEGSDWMNLGAGQTSGLSFYAPRPNNVIGYVSLTAKENNQLQEKTDREGFVDTPHSRNFFLIIGGFVQKLNIFFNRLGRSYLEYRKLSADKLSGLVTPTSFVRLVRETSKKAKKAETRVEELDQNLDPVTKSVRDVITRTKDTPLLSSQEERELSPLLTEVNSILIESRSLVQELRTLLTEMRQLSHGSDSLLANIEILESQLTQFSELAGLGLTAEALSHEMHIIADRLAHQTRSIVDSLKKRGMIDSELVAYTEYVHSAISTLRKQLSHLAPSLRYVRERKDELKTLEFFTDIKVFYAERFQREEMQFCISKQFDNFRIRINKGKLTQIVDNIILNSDYWLREASRRREIINPTVTVKSLRPFITIYDNGLGVDQSVEHSMFQPFVTTKPKNVGRGLGLFIVRELLDSSGCSISLLPERNKFGRRYIFQIDFTGVLHGE